jgi:hypothetical protein
VLTVRHFNGDLFAEQRSAEVAQAGVNDHRHNGPRLGVLPRQFQRCLYVAAGGNTAQDSFLAREPSGHLDGVHRRNGHNPVEQVHIEDVRDESVADPLDLMWSPFAAGDDRALLWLDGEDLDVGIALAQEARNARERPASAL